METVAAPGIRLDEAGVAWLEGTRTKVNEVVLCQQAGGLTIAGVHDHLPHLTLAQIEAALAYYDAHQEELDAEIERDLKYVLDLKATLPKGPTRLELLARLKHSQ